MPAKPKPIDHAQVEKLAGNFCTNAEIAAEQNCSSDTVERRCAASIEKGRQKGKLSLRAQQFRVAMGLPGQPAQYLRDKDGDYVWQEGKLVCTQQEVKPIPPSNSMLIWLGKQYLNQSDKFTLPDEFHEGYSFSFQKNAGKK